ncbi:type IVB secretion system coupling complex protein DotM/IcmP [Aquicella lusitana]|uniref:Intracellular multiplication protein IcmP n=1 Tax=Aquicella lusitana TaxID=254246 RepID=A0A370GY80_9COXI|nr:type IVB secretion system coupling complex protein DotM/IcmP [Aquicella lusitana]RDI48608.1 intracellular multiplication protein IcmP [Aquicella lusitana]VVC74015.1 hypothetical protein AQULUS_17770 [Aquicella lusitana]
MAAAPQGNQSDNSNAMLWSIAAVFAAMGAVWYVFKNQIAYFYLQIKLYEAKFLTIFSDRFERVQANIQAMQVNVDKTSFNDLINIGITVGDWLRYPFIVILIALAFAVYFGNSTRIFRRTYSMKDLAVLEKGNWPQISPVIGLDLVKTDIDKGPWSMAMSPLQFCKRFKLLEEVRPQRREGMSRKDWDRVEVVLKRGESNKIFAMQLGQLWKGVERLPPHAKALFAAFAARINADSKGAANLLAQLAASSGSGKLNVAGVNELLKKHMGSKAVQRIVQSHAYVLTVMASMLEGAREDGVQASADFLWLKPMDRRLWYTLNTVGRQTPFAEVAGVFAHWVAEKEAGRKLMVPMVEEATNALELALKEVVYHPDEQQ